MNHRDLYRAVTAEIENLMRQRPREYFRDESLQQRYRQLASFRTRWRINMTESVERARDVILSTGIDPEVLAEIVREASQAIHHPQFLPNLRRQIIEYGVDEAKADRLANAFSTLVRAAG